MKFLESKALRQKSVDELNQLLKHTFQEKFEFKRSFRLGQLKSSHLFQKFRAQIALLKTLLWERGIDERVPTRRKKDR